MVGKTWRPLAFGIVVLLLGFPLLEIVAGPAELAAPAAQAAEKPSILAIQLDDLRTDEYELVMTQTRAALSGGASFAHYIAGGTPLCCPNRASALTGQYPHNTDVLTNGAPWGGHQRLKLIENDEERSIALILQEAGYHTGYIGKYVNGYPADTNYYIPDGWDDWFGIIENGSCGSNCSGGGDGYYYTYYMNDNGDVRYFGNSAAAYQTNVFQEKALSIIEDAVDADAPLFLWVNPSAPHHPSIAGPGDTNAQVDTQYRTPAFNLHGADKATWVSNLPALNGKVQAFIDERNLARRRSLPAADRMVPELIDAMPPGSYIFFFSDNGYLLGEHRIPIGKIAPYRPSAEVPLEVIRKESRGDFQGGRIDQVVSTVDLAPTWAAIAGTDTPQADGVSLLPLLEGGTFDREEVLLEFAGWGTGLGQQSAMLDGDLLPASLLRPYTNGKQGNTVQAEGKKKKKKKQNKKEKRQKKKERKQRQKKKNKCRSIKKKPKRKKCLKRLKRQKKRNQTIKLSEATYIPPPYVALRGDTWLYIKWEGDVSKTEEYYDYANDPYEETNIFNSLPVDEKELLRSRVEELRICAGPDCS